ncbi:MAG: hypothetical protein KJ752_14905 [Alphaproteobacteria bacterium]|nr:hypothetical protein [Alphaproteobacteria bacterium]MBU0795247.1 hypothetical protein [Alphaproteobacteria bacterium]MBU0876689.1 hypothetical protein [Alphaproteobacteria bacterium]
MLLLWSSIIWFVRTLRTDALQVHFIFGLNHHCFGLVGQSGMVGEPPVKALFGAAKGG